MNSTDRYAPQARCDLAEELRASTSDRRLLTALGVPTHGAGALPALRTAVRVMAAAVRRHDTPRAQDWLQKARDLLVRVTHASAERSWLEIQGPMLTGRSVCHDLGHPVRSTLPKAAQEGLDAWLGLHLFHALAQGGPLSTQVTADWNTLLRTGQRQRSASDPWHALALAMPLEAPELQTAFGLMGNGRLKDALRGTLVALTAELTDPALLDAPHAGAQACAPEDAGDLDVTSMDDGTGDAFGEVSDGEDALPSGSGRGAAEAPGHSPLGWILRASTFAGYRSRFGIAGLYGELPPEELREVCRALAAVLKEGTDDEQSCAALAEVSLKSSLPPKLALSLPLAPDGEVWLDVDGEAVMWNYRRAIGQDGCDPVPIRLGALAGRRLRTLLAARPQAGSLATLLSIAPEGQASWIRRYGAFLRERSPGPYKAYVARFASSYHGAFHARRHGPALAAFLSLDFRALPPGMLHYLHFSADHLADVQRDVDASLGIDWHVEAAGAEA